MGQIIRAHNIKRYVVLVLTVLVLIVTVPSLSGCSQVVTMESAGGANDPQCAAVMVRVPAELDGLNKRSTDAQATAAWGDPVGVKMWCGVAVASVTDETCTRVNGIDWLADGSGDPMWTFTTYGRNPAVQVMIDKNNVKSSSGILANLVSSVSQSKQTKQCTAPTEDLNLPPDTGSSDSGSGD